MSTLMYGSECWTISSEMEKKLGAMEMQCYRRMSRLSWKKKVTNEEGLKKVGKNAYEESGEEAASIFETHNSKEKLENYTVTGKIEGK